MKENNTYHEEMDGINLPEYLRDNPFNTPENYFEELSAKTVAQIKLAQFAASTNKGFNVPEGYFDQLQETIIATVAIHTKTGKDTPWETPTGYFESLSEKVQQQVRIAKNIPLEQTLSVPTNYFEDLSARIHTRIFEEDLKTIVPLEGLTVPNAYFEKLTKNIVSKTIDQGNTKEAKQSVIRTLRVGKWVRYAAAACITSVLGISSYNYINKQNQQNNNIEAHLDAIPEQEIINYLTSSNDGDDIVYIMEYIYQPEESEGVGSHQNEDDIEDYLNYTL